MAIKTRILFCVFLLEVLGYSILLLYNAHYSEKALVDIRAKQVEAVFYRNLNRIDALTHLMEKHVQDLASVGELFYDLKREQPKQVLMPSFQRLLVKDFLHFPQSIGGGVWYEPNVYDTAVRYFGPYVYREKGQVKFTWDLSAPEYDYHNQSWYLQALPRHWDRAKKRPEHCYWTDPYYDEAGSLALMMTVDALMYAPEGQIIGVATVDWALGQTTDFISKTRITPGSYPFLVDSRSRKFVSYGKDPKQVMQSIDNFAWTSDLLNGETGMLQRKEGVFLDGEEYYLYTIGTEIGLLFGVLVPVAEFNQEIEQITHKNFQVGLYISIVFISLMILLLQWLFKPFVKVLHLISGSVTREPGKSFAIHHLHYPERNEFSPIIATLNEVYAQVEQHTHTLAQANVELSKQQTEIELLNESLEHRVQQRTAALEKSNLQLKETLNDLENARQDLVEAEKMAALGNLVAGIAHEINTPLGVAVTAITELSRRNQQFMEQYQAQRLRRSSFEQYLALTEKATTMVYSNLRRAAELVRSFKQVSVDQSAEDQKCFLLKDYLDQILMSLEPELKKHQHVITVLCKDHITLDSFPGAFSQVIINLVMNSLVHAYDEGQRGRIVIECSELDSRIALRYSDDGKGVKAEGLKRIFEPFYTTRRGLGGSGLGLHIVYNLVTHTLQGSIRCHSIESQGITFHLILPLQVRGNEPDSAAELA